MKKVFIGVGHGGSDSGAVGVNGLLEKNLNLSIALACKDELEKHGVAVEISRTRDENGPLHEKIKECNTYNPGLAVDIHNNAGGGDGVEVFYSRVGGQSKRLAENILQHVASLGQKSRGTKTRTTANGFDYYAFIRETKAPAVIVECAFVDSADIALIDTEAERIKVGQAIARGIINTLGIAYKPDKHPTVLYRVQVGAYGSKVNAEATAERLRSIGFDAVIIKA